MEIRQEVIAEQFEGGTLKLTLSCGHHLQESHPAEDWDDRQTEGFVGQIRECDACQG